MKVTFIFVNDWCANVSSLLFTSSAHTVFFLSLLFSKQVVCVVILLWSYHWTILTVVSLLLSSFILFLGLALSLSLSCVIFSHSWSGCVVSVIFFFHFCFSVVLISCMERGRLSRTACSRLCVSRTVGMYCSFYIHICKEFVCTVQIMFVV